MSFGKELKGLFGWVKNMSPVNKILLQGLLIFLAFLVPTSRASLVGPGLAVGFWTLLTLENRSVTAWQLIFFGVLGAFILLPLAAILETPFRFFASAKSIWPIGLSAGLEFLLLGAVLIGLCQWPKSRLRYTAGMMDFALIGLWLGAGMEFGIGFLQADALNFRGLNLGLWPQLPGMLSRPDLPLACASPLTLGLLAGLSIGFGRYLAGPDFKGKIFKIRFGVWGAFLLMWIVAERWVFVKGPATTLGNLLFWLDLKGRLLAYLSGLAALIALVVEWLLLQEQPAAQELKDPFRSFTRVWQAGKGKATWERLSDLLLFQYRRLRIRERVFGEEICSLLTDRDKEKLNQRIALIRETLGKAEGQGYGTR